MPITAKSLNVPYILINIIKSSKKEINIFFIDVYILKVWIKGLCVPKILIQHAYPIKFYRIEPRFYKHQLRKNSQENT